MTARITTIEELREWVRAEIARRETQNTYDDAAYYRNEGVIAALEEVRDMITEPVEYRRKP